MSSFDFIVDNIRFSYSSTSNFYNCPYAFKLTYIDLEERINNFYGQYGSFVHLCYEKFFLKEVKEDEMGEFYSSNYRKHVKLAPPRYPYGLAEKYRIGGI